LEDELKSTLFVTGKLHSGACAVYVSIFIDCVSIGYEFACANFCVLCKLLSEVDCHLVEGGVLFTSLLFLGAAEPELDLV